MSLSGHDKPALETERHHPGDDGHCSEADSQNCLPKQQRLAQQHGEDEHTHAGCNLTIFFR